MTSLKLCLFGLLFFLCLHDPLYSYWPTTVEENLPIATDPDTSEIWCSALPYPNGQTLVVLDKGWFGNCYQIVDKYGQPRFPLPQSLTPGFLSGYMCEPHVVPDGFGGAFIAWNYNGFIPPTGIFAQRLDSLGNIMWGDSGKVISPLEDDDFDISTDGQGGFFLAVVSDDADTCAVNVQRIDGSGNILWGPQGVGFAGSSTTYARYPRITNGSQGDAYVAWNGSYGMWGTIFMNRVNSSGVKMWVNDLQIGGTQYCKIISDGEGGAIIQYGAGAVNGYKRIDLYGNVIWANLNQLSWYPEAGIMLGGQGYFYLGFVYQYGYYGQKVRISDGQNMWPNQPGATMAYLPGWGSGGAKAYAYFNNNFYGVFQYSNPNQRYKNLYCQVLDSVGNRLMGENGFQMTTIEYNGYYQYPNIVPTTDGGIVIVWEKDYEYDVWAKRANMDGTLGGPLPPVEGTVISISGNNVVLNWNSVAEASCYHIFCSMNPYEFGQFPYATVNDTTFIDINALPAGKAFYRVTWEP